MFPKPRPNNLVTVPACLPCNEAWAKDGEYFRAVVAASANLANDPSAGRVRDAVVRSLQRPDSAGLAARIRSAFVGVEVQSHGGIHLGEGIGLRVDLSRLHAVLRQTIRGLFFVEARMPLPKDCEVRVLLDQFGDHVRTSMKKHFGGRPKAHINRIGDVFEYSVFPVPNDPTSLWVGTFFRRVFFMGYVCRNGGVMESAAG